MHIKIYDVDSIENLEEERYKKISKIFNNYIDEAKKSGENFVGWFYKDGVENMNYQEIKYYFSDVQRFAKENKLNIVESAYEFIPIFGFKLNNE